LINSIIKVSKFPDHIFELSKIINSFCYNNPELALASILLENKGNYSDKHAIDTAIVAVIIAQDLECTSEFRRDLIGAALTMNIGMRKVQNQCYFTENALTEDQRRQINTHPDIGVDILKKLCVDEERNKYWLATVKEHHQEYSSNEDKYKEKGKMAQILSFADIFTAGLMKRGGGRETLPSFDILVEKRSRFEKYVNSDLLDLCLKSISFYLPGTFVKIKDNKIKNQNKWEDGVVISRCNKEIRAEIPLEKRLACHPVVKIRLKESGKTDKFENIDCSEQITETKMINDKKTEYPSNRNRYEIKIVSAEEAGFKINLNSDNPDNSKESADDRVLIYGLISENYRRLLGIK